MYAEEGTSFSIVFSVPNLYGTRHYETSVGCDYGDFSIIKQDDEHGGTADFYTIEGVLEEVGDCVIYGDGPTRYTITIHVVPMSVADLIFESDPVTDGILIPPGHHLVTFVDSYGILDPYWIFVEDGHILTKYDDPDWSDAAPRPYRIGSADGEDLTSYEVHGNVTVYYGNHHGSWPDDGDGSGGSSGQD